MICLGFHKLTRLIRLTFPLIYCVCWNGCFSSLWLECLSLFVLRVLMLTVVCPHQSTLFGQLRPLRSMVVELGIEFLQTAKAEILDLSKVQLSNGPFPTLGEGGTEEQESQGVVFC